MLVSSHLMSELEDIADDLVVIGRGRLIAQTSVERAARVSDPTGASTSGRRRSRRS